MTDIGVRLKVFRQRSSIKMPAIAAATDIGKGTLYKWEKGTKPSDIKEYFKLKAYLDKMEGKFEEDAFEIENQKPATLRIPLFSGRSSVSQTDGKAAAGTVILVDNDPELIVDRINAPFMGPVDGVIEVTGDSMEPTFENGCRVAISRLKSYRALNWGLCYYIIDINLKGVVRRIFEGNNDKNIRLVSDNPNQEVYPPFERTPDEIVAIFKVCASIKKY